MLTRRAFTLDLVMMVVVGMVMGSGNDAIRRVDEFMRFVDVSYLYLDKFFWAKFAYRCLHLTGLYMSYI